MAVQADAPSSSNLDDVCKLCRATGFNAAAGRKPPNYPEEYFRRYPLPRPFVQMVLGRLRTDDVYTLIGEYPNPEHRSTALATQASMIYVMLYFAPEILQNDQVGGGGPAAAPCSHCRSRGGCMSSVAACPPPPGGPAFSLAPR